MIIVIGDRDFLFSLEVIGYFNDYFVYLAFQRSHCEYVAVILTIFEILEKLVFLVFLLICMNECLSEKGATNWSKLLLIDLNVLAFQFPGAKEPRSQTGCGLECLNAIFLSD